MPRTSEASVPPPAFASGFASPSPTAPPPADYAAALRRERLDASILKSLGRWRALRSTRTDVPSFAWENLERLVSSAATVLWENGPTELALEGDLLAFCAFLAREIEVTESLGLTAAEEQARLEEVAPRALAALDEIGGELASPQSESSPVMRALAIAFGTIRAELMAACLLEWRIAA